MTTGTGGVEEAAGPSVPVRRKIVIVDDHPVIRQGLTTVINQQPDMVVSGSVASVQEALEWLNRDRPDLMVVDIVLRESSGLELVKDIRTLDPTLPIVVLSMHDESLYAERVLRAGAMGYVMKHEPVERLLDAIRKALDGQIGVSEAVSSKLLRSLVGPDRAANPLRTGVASLSDRELEVFGLIGAGLPTRAIADKLSLGLKTVETHRAAIKLKLKVKSGLELIQRATLWVAEKKDPGAGDPNQGARSP